jgi:DNA phosphorothioation-associated putative methyltransferase
MLPESQAIPRHKTAIHRPGYSRPVQLALRDGLLTIAVSFFDYGCGHGQDLALLQTQGIACSGWDPVFRPAAPQVEADIVNLASVLNVIESPAERLTTLRRAWQLARRLLIVAAQVRLPGRGDSQVEFGDGILTHRGTFQKYYEQGELKQLLEAQLEAEAIPAALGIFYVFKDEALRQSFLASRYQRRPATPRPRLSQLRFEESRELLEPLLTAVTQLGRLPEADELPLAAEVIQRFGSLKRAFAQVRRVTGPDEWDALRRRRTEDLLVFLALARFRKRPPLSRLPRELQRDIRAFFGTYARGCRQADELLFQAGQAEAIDAACRRSAVGKLLPNALYVHTSALDCLEPLLRVYEGCGRAYLGEVEGANVLKLHRFSGKISYLAYPDFDTDPHPVLGRCVKLSLRTRQLECLDYTQSANPPILHRKEAFLHPDHPLHGKFARLTRLEERHGLLDEAATIGTRAGWEARLRQSGLRPRGHRLVTARVEA